jgi:hypothetical protein
MKSEGATQLDRTEPLAVVYRTLCLPCAIVFILAASGITSSMQVAAPLTLVGPCA